MHLLPVTKLQFERFLCDASVYGDSWYEGLLALNPRVSPRRADAASREGLLLTGVLPDEALAFAAWCGPEYDLPTVDEWRAACAEWARAPAWNSGGRTLSPIPRDVRAHRPPASGEGGGPERGEGPGGEAHSGCVAVPEAYVPPPVRLLLDWWLGQPATSAADQALFRGGIVEWVRDGEAFVGLGAPRPEFLPNLWDPLADVVRPLRPEERSRAFGFRLVRRQAGS
jgi:hypothetical protein